MGRAPIEATRPTTNALSDSWRASHPTAIVCIQEPTSDRVCPVQKMR